MLLWDVNYNCWIVLWCTTESSAILCKLNSRYTGIRHAWNTQVMNSGKRLITLIVSHVYATFVFETATRNKLVYCWFMISYYSKKLNCFWRKNKCVRSQCYTHCLTLRLIFVNNNFFSGGNGQYLYNIATWYSLCEHVFTY